MADALARLSSLGERYFSPSRSLSVNFASNLRKKYQSTNTYKSTTYPANSKIIQKKLQKNLAISEKGSNFATQTRNNDASKEFEANLKQGAIAQLVEQRTENPCVPGSIPGGTTSQNAKYQ